MRGRWLRRFAHSDQGAEITEFAFVLPAFLLVILASMQIALIGVVRYEVKYLTRETARWLAVNPDTMDANLLANLRSEVMPCTNGSYNPSFTSGSTQNWCSSKMAYTGGAGNHPCPGAWNITKASRTDVFLWQISSSTPGTCDHYFPLSKTEQLPAYFQQIAGAIARGKLVS
jgi:Flp pilus assembly protein TadG